MMRMCRYNSEVLAVRSRDRLPLPSRVFAGAKATEPITILRVAKRPALKRITTPGGIPHGMSIRLIEEGHSLSRNRALALACKYMHIIESWGSGVLRIQEMLREAGLMPLRIQDNGIDVVFTIQRRARGNQGETVNETVNETVSETVNGATQESTQEIQTTQERDDLNTAHTGANREGNEGNREGNREGNEGGADVRVLAEIKRNSKVTIAELVKRLGLSHATVERAQRLLQSTGLIRRIGGTRGAWEILK